MLDQKVQGIYREKLEINRDKCLFKCILANDFNILSGFVFVLLVIKLSIF